MIPKPDEQVNVLAVDDSPEKLLALSVVLSELNQNVVTATSGREALRQLLRQEFAVVFVLSVLLLPELLLIIGFAVWWERRN